MSGFDLNSLGPPVVYASSPANSATVSPRSTNLKMGPTEDAHTGHQNGPSSRFDTIGATSTTIRSPEHGPTPPDMAGAPNVTEQERSDRDGIPHVVGGSADTQGQLDARQSLIDHVRDPNARIDHHQGQDRVVSTITSDGDSRPAYDPSKPNDTSRAPQPHAAAVQHDVHIPYGDKFSSLSAIGAGGGARPNEKDTVTATDVKTRTPIVPATTSLSPASGSAGTSATNPAANGQSGTTLPTAPTVHPEAQAQALTKAQQEDPELVRREVQKAEAGKREVMGEMPKSTIVEGIEDDRLWALLRRFDVQVTHAVISMSHTSTAHANEPDLRRSTLPSIPYNNDVLRSNIERMYSTLGIVAIRTFNEVTRLRSWSPQERRRTGTFAAVYFTAWVFGMAIPVLVAFIIVLVVSEESRPFFFPPMLPPEGTPPSATDPRSEKGDESLMGGVDSEVVHRSRTEQIEEQAWEFRQLAEGFAVKMAVAKGDGRGKQGNAEVGAKDHYNSDNSSSSDSDEDPENLPDGATEIDPALYAPGEHPAEVRAAHKRSQENKGIHRHRDRHDSQGGTQGQQGKTKMVKDKDGVMVEKPMSEKERKKVEAREAKAKRDRLISKSLKLLQDGMGDTADFIECLANAMSPPHPFPPTLARYKLAGGILVPVMILTAVVPAWIWAKAGSFALGFGFFGQPLIDRGTTELLRLLERIPDWKEYLDLRNSLLSGVPTNDQLVLHLLRVGERANKPLPRPPAPPLAGTPKEAIKDTAPHPDDDLVDSDGEPISVGELPVADKVKHKAKSGIVGAFKGLSKRVAAIGADVTVDGVRKKIGTRVDRVVFGGLLEDDGDNETYPCRLDKVDGHIYLEPTALTGGPAIVSFKGIHDASPRWSRSVDDLVEIKKGGVSVPRAVLGWMSGADIESQTLLLRFLTRKERRENKRAREENGLESQEGQVYELHSMVRREQAFVRLLSMGSSQRWESI